MPRNGSGTYSLPAGNPVVSGTTIQSTWANSTLTDVGDALTGSLARDGTGGMSGALRLADGSISIPGLAFAAETTTGFSRPTTNAIVASVSAVEKMRINASGLSVTGALDVSGGITGAITGAVTSSSATITGGTINGTTIGATTPSTAAFTTVTASGNVTLSGGAANGVAYLNGSKIVTSGSSLTFDGNNLGIGTSSPASKLDIVGATQTLARIKGGASSSQSAAYYVIKAGSGGTLCAFGDSAAITGGTVDTSSTVFSDVPLNFYINGAERMRIDATGAIGIAGANYGTSGQVLTSGGSGAAPSWSALPSASTSAQGIVELATDAETQTGTDTTRAVTAAGFRSANIMLGTAVASTSGTSIDFTGIPSWAKRVTVMFNVVSTSGSSVPLVQLGDAGGIETSGYAGVVGVGQQANNWLVASLSAGFSIATTGGDSDASNVYSGSMILSKVTGNNWVCQSSIGQSAGSAVRMHLTSGGKTLSDVLDRVRITTAGGTDTFDAGTINVSWE